MRRMSAILAVAIIGALFTIPSVRAQSANKISSYALRTNVRGYSCANWAGITPQERSSYLLGVIALSDALEHGANDDSFSLTTDDYKALNLPRSANDYVTMVTSGCGQVAGTTPVLAVLFQIK